MTRAPSLQARLEALWWQVPASAGAHLLQPLAWLYGRLAARQQRATTPEPSPVPVLVVGNLIVGGAGKTPTVIALVQALRALGWRPGVISRGYGRRDDAPQAVTPASTPQAVGDEPLLIARRASVPVWVGQDRRAAARALCRAHPEVDLLVADDGLQHHRLARNAELLVFDERGVGNGLLLPAGPLREPLPAALLPHQRVLYTGGVPSTPLPGACARRHLTWAWPLDAWHSGDAGRRVPLADLAARSGRAAASPHGHGAQPPTWLAAAGMAAPEKFFGMLEAAGLHIRRCALPDHHPYTTLPWPADTPDVLVTEKDAVKLQPERMGDTRVWVLPLDLELPAALAADLAGLLSRTRSATTP